jgi:hypothetical protein
VVRVNIIFQFGKRIEACCILVGDSFKNDVQSITENSLFGPGVLLDSFFVDLNFFPCLFEPRFFFFAYHVTIF